MIAYEDFERFASNTAAAEYLLGRVRAWKASKLCRTTPPGKRRALSTWLRERDYETPDGEWNRQYRGPGNTAEPDAPPRLQIENTKPYELPKSDPITPEYRRKVEEFARSIRMRGVAKAAGGAA